MQPEKVKSDVDTVILAKGDVTDAWAQLERLVISLRRIGSAFAVPGGQGLQSPAQRHAMLEAIGDVLTPEFVADLNRARCALGDYLSNDEAEAISETLRTWQPK